MLALFGLGFWFWSAGQAKAKQTPTVAYLYALTPASRVKLTWWHSTPLATALPVRSGGMVRIPLGQRVGIIYPDGRTDNVAGPVWLRFQQIKPAEPDLFTAPLADVSVVAQAIAARPRDHSTITSPVGMTRYLNPLITWAAREGILYDVAVADAVDTNAPERTAFGVRPPIALADLQTPQRRQLGVDRNYQIGVREAGSSTILGAARFLTTTDAQLENQIPATPAELIVEAVAAMAKAPTRTGDAWLALSHLPPDWAQSELGVRLRLRVAAELGLPDELAQAQEEARRLLKH